MRRKWGAVVARRAIINKTNGTSLSGLVVAEHGSGRAGERILELREALLLGEQHQRMPTPVRIDGAAYVLAGEIDFVQIEG